MRKQVFLFRHGQPADGGQDVCRGNKLDTPLSECGLEQTRNNIRHLQQRFTRDQLERALIVTSPLQRAAYFGEQFHVALGTRHEVDPAMTDIDVGTWEGKSWQEIEEQWKTQFDLCWSDALSLDIPGAGESVSDFVERITKRWEYWMTQSSETLLIFCAHKAVNKIVLDTTARRLLTFRGQKIGCMNELRIDDAGAASIIHEDKKLYLDRLDPAVPCS